MSRVTNFVVTIQHTNTVYYVDHGHIASMNRFHIYAIIHTIQGHYRTYHS